MLTLDEASIYGLENVQVEEEPALEIAIPQVFSQSELMTLVRGKLGGVENRILQLYRQHQQNPDDGLGADYQAIVTEFQPLFAWAMASWDFLLSTEGCRFLPRFREMRLGQRGDYRAFTDKDFSRLVHRVFRQCVLEFAEAPEPGFLASWLRERFWARVTEAYRGLSRPTDPRQRPLSAYSYLRCTPYEFLNQFHQDLVDDTLSLLPQAQQQAVSFYFLYFFTEDAAAQQIGYSTEAFLATLRQALLTLLVRHRLVYCLLRQIERY